MKTDHVQIAFLAIGLILLAALQDMVPPFCGAKPPFLLVFALCYVDEPIRYVIMQVHMYSRKWIKPVSDEGRATIDEFRRKYNVKVR